jgi:hypothetical protein
MFVKNVNMDWGFYRFTWSKLLIFILLAIPSMLFIWSEAGRTDAPMHPLTWPVTLVFFWPFLAMYGFENLIFVKVDWIHPVDIPFVLLALLINIAYIYSAASLIAHYFDNRIQK